MKGWMTSVNHWVRVMEGEAKLRFLRAFGRVGGARGSEVNLWGRRDVETWGRWMRVQKNFRVEFEPRPDTRCNFGHVHTRTQHDAGPADSEWLIAV